MGNKVDIRVPYKGGYTDLRLWVSTPRKQEALGSILAAPGWVSVSAGEPQTLNPTGSL